MRQTIPKFVITALALLAFPQVCGIVPSEDFNWVTMWRSLTAVQELLDRRVHTTTHEAINTTFMKVDRGEKQEGVIPNNLPCVIIREIGDFPVGVTFHEMIQTVLKSVFHDTENAIATKIANAVTEMA